MPNAYETHSRVDPLPAPPFPDDPKQVLPPLIIHSANTWWTVPLCTSGGVCLILGGLVCLPVRILHSYGNACPVCPLGVTDKTQIDIPNTINTGYQDENSKFLNYSCFHHFFYFLPNHQDWLHSPPSDGLRILSADGAMWHSLIISVSSVTKTCPNIAHSTASSSYTVQLTHERLSDLVFVCIGVCFSVFASVFHDRQG